MGRKKIYESREEYARIRSQQNKDYYRECSLRNHDPEKKKKHAESFKKSEKYMVASKKWNKENRERINQRTKERKSQNPHLKLQDSVASIINSHLKNKSQKTNEYLGCSYEDYIIYLENKFDNNMTWDNYGKGKYWEIDHIYPLSKGGSFHYTNTRPYPISDNRKKKDKIEN